VSLIETDLSTEASTKFVFDSSYNQTSDRVVRTGMW
jgi:hypothetical protein